MAFCLPPKIVDQFKLDIVNGKLSPDRLSQIADMSTEKRLEVFDAYFGKEYSKNINYEFEKRLLSKNRELGYVRWAEKIQGLTPERKTEIIDKIRKAAALDEKSIDFNMKVDSGEITLKEGQTKRRLILSPENEDEFLRGVAGKALGVDATAKEARIIAEASSIVDILEEEYMKDPKNIKKKTAYGNSLLDLMDYMQTLKEKPTTYDQIAGVFNTPRALMATADLSAAGRQGWGSVFTKEYWQNIKPMFKMFADEKFAKDEMARIIADPYYRRAKKDGVGLTAFYHDLAGKEDAYMTQVVSNWPGVKHSERAYVGFLNKLRFDQYKNQIMAAEALGIDVRAGSKAAKDIASVINNFTGYGTVGSEKIKQVIPGLNSIFFSPRKIAATMQMFNPYYYVKLSPTARKLALKRLLGMTTASISLLALGKMMGAEIENDPRSADFGKIKVGDTRIDVTGGNANYVTFLSRLLTNKTKSTTSDIVRELGVDYGTKNRLYTTVDYFRYKLSPTAAFVVDSLLGKTAIGEKVTVGQQLRDHIVPMVITSFLDAFKSDPKFAALALVSDFFGLGVTTYDSGIDWNSSDAKEINQFKAKVGQKNFDYANKVYNKRLTESVEKIKKDPRYQKLSSEDKLVVQNNLRRKEKERIFNQYGFNPTRAKSNPTIKSLTR